jgi:hypothetical protein
VRDAIDELDHFLRTEFVRINTQLEELYFAERVDVIIGRSDVEALKSELLTQGGPLMERVADLQALPPDPRDQYRLLGLVGHYLAACQRHEAPLSDSEGGRQAAWDVSLRIGASLNVAPRIVFAHQSLFNDAIGDRFRTFTALRDEEIFIRYNALGILGYYRAAHALRGIAGIGVTSAVAAYLFDEAETALLNVLKFNQELGRQLDVDRFFFNIRPYFKTYRVGAVDYRGANAGDFSAINEIDVMLGLCSMDDPFYRAIVKEKLPYVPPDDQSALRALDRQRPLVDEFCSELDAVGPSPGWKANAARFLAVCKAHAAAYAYHHHRFIKAYIEAPAKTTTTAHSAGVTSSGPPLDAVVAMLHRLLELRSVRPGVSAASAQLARIQEQVNA